MPVCEGYRRECETNASFRCPSCGSCWCMECLRDDDLADPTQGDAFCPKPSCMHQLEPLSEAQRIIQQVRARGQTPRRRPAVVQNDHGRVMRRIKQFVIRIGGRVYTMPQNPTHLCGDEGVPDLEAFIPVAGGFRLVKIEAKSPETGDEPSDEQEEYAEWCDKAGVPHVYGDENDVSRLVMRLWTEAGEVQQYRAASDPGGPDRP